MVEEYCQKWRSKSSTPFDIESFAAPLKLAEKEEIVANLLASQTLEIKSLSEETKLDSVCASHLLPYQLAVSSPDFRNLSLSLFFVVRLPRPEVLFLDIRPNCSKS
jgi:hypothetical protein